MSFSNRTRRHVLYAAIITLIAVIAGYKGVLPVFRSHLMRYLEIGDDRFGLLFSIGSVTGMCSVLFGGHLIDRWGPRRVIRLCLTGVGCAMLLVGLGGARFPVFMVAVGISGAFSAPLFIAINAYLGKLFPQHQRRVISLNLASTSVGGLMFPIVAETLLYVSGRYDSVTFAQVLHYPFLLVGSLLLCGSFVYRARGNWKKVAVHRTGQKRHRSWKNLLLPPRSLLLVVLIVLHGTADSTLYMWMPRFLESGSFAVELFAPGLVLSGYAFSYVFARAVLGVLPDRVGSRSLLVLPGLIGGSFVILGILSSSFLLTAGGYVLGALCWSFEYPAIVSTLMRFEKRRFGKAMALSGMLSGLFLFLSMNTVGILTRRLGEAQMGMVMLLPASLFIVVGIGGGMWIILFERGEKT